MRQRQFRCLKRPEVKACLMQARQHGHAANRARAHRSRASYLEGRLGAESLVGMAEATPARRVMMTRARLTGSTPEWFAALAKPALSVFRSQLPQRACIRAALFAQPPRRKGKGKVEAYHQVMRLRACGQQQRADFFMGASAFESDGICTPSSNEDVTALTSRGHAS